MYICCQWLDCHIVPTRFYGRNSSYVHGGLDSSGKLAEAVYGQAVGAEILMNTLKMYIIYWKTHTDLRLFKENSVTNPHMLLLVSVQCFDSVLFSSLRRSTRRLCPCSLMNATPKSDMWMLMPHSMMELWCKSLENYPTMVSPWGSSCKPLFLRQRWVLLHTYTYIMMYNTFGGHKIVVCFRFLNIFLFFSWPFFRDLSAGFGGKQVLCP